MRLFDNIFNRTPATPTPAPATAPQTPPATSPEAFQKSPTPDPAAVPTSAMEPYTDLFKVDPAATPAPADEAYITYNADTFGKQVQNLQFIGGEQAQNLAAAAAKGDPNALIELVNLTAQKAYAEGAKLTANASNIAAKASRDDMTNRLPNHLRANDAKSELTTLNPALNHPAVAPVVSMIQSQIEAKNPGASGKEIAGMVNNFFLGLSKVATPNQPATQQQTQIDASQDFTNFFAPTNQTSFR